MPRRKRSPEENERRAKIRELLLSSNISSMEDIQDLFKETIAELMADLRSVYAAVDEPAALDALDAFSTKWETKYPKISRSWRENWANLSTYFKYPQEVRRLGSIPNFV